LEYKFEAIPIDNIAENEFWVQSVKILKANLFVAEHPNLYPIRMMNFACGPDSLKIYQEENIHEAAGKPLLTLLTDAQTNNAPFVTRTEAHERVVNQTKPEKLRIEDLRPRKCSTDNNDQRIWLIPYMGDASHVAISALKHFGIGGRVLPTNTQNGYEIARRHIHTEVCHPLKGVVGDAMGFLNEQVEKKGKRYVEDNYLVMLPTTSGPCRFGKYTEVLRILMDRECLGKVPIAGPSSETDYFDIPVPEKVGASNQLEIQKVLFKGINASDLLEDITLRYRPYAEDKQQINDLKKERLRVLGEVIENGAGTADLIEWGKETVSKYSQTKLRYHDRFPLVLYIGEIYMRQHDPYTDFVIQKLEDKQLEMVRDPITDWLLYVNQMNRRNSRRDIRLAIKNWDSARAWNETRKLARSFLKGKYMSKIADKIAHPFHEVLHGRHCLPKPIDIIDTLEKNHKFHGNIEGESPLSTGIAYYFMNDLIKPEGDAYISGIFHVGPFTCMQEGVATAKIEAMAKELRKIKDDLVFPIIHAFFGDSPNPNLDAEIAVFTEQCYQKRDMLKEKYGGGLSIDTTSRSTSMRSPSQIADIDNKRRAPRAYEKVD
jgi:predicted nucleotide-binding protein (sugar kinase/HSP70/actin superfamily)